MEGAKPGLWIGAAITLAVLVVAISMPGDRKPADVATQQQTTGRGKGTVQTPSSSLTPPSEPKSPPTQTDASQPAAPKSQVAVRYEPPLPPEDPPIPPPPPSFEPSLVTPEVAAQAIDRVHFALRDLRTVLGGNPVGNNAEITAAILGDNAKQVRIDMPEGSRMNEKRELCDPWGTPYFFHQQSRTEMEIRSAGPDMVLWTKDDIVM